MTILYVSTPTHGATLKINDSFGSNAVTENSTSSLLLEHFPFTEKENNLASTKARNSNDIAPRLGLFTGGTSLDNIIEGLRESMSQMLESQQKLLVKRLNEIMNKFRKVIMEKIESFLTLNDELGKYFNQLLEQIFSGSAENVNHVQQKIKKFLTSVMKNFDLLTIKPLSDDDNDSTY